MMAQKPLMLKDFLELDANSDSCDDFPCALRRPDAATVRCLLEAELDERLIRSRSKGALTRISAVINAVRLFSFSSPADAGSRQGSLLPRSFSKKLRRSFWKKRGEGEENESRVRVRDIVRLRSFEEEDGEERRSLYFPSPVVSSCSSSSDGDGDSSGSDFLLSSCGSSECFGETEAAAATVGSADGKGHSPRKSPIPNSGLKGKTGVDDGGDHRETATGRREPKDAEMEGTECGGCQSEEEKDQLSPVSVMDFPYQDEEEEEDGGELEATTSPGFPQNLANIERTRHQLLQKIRRFESLAELQLDPLDLGARFASFEDPLESSDHVESDDEEEEESRTGGEKRAWDLLRQLKARTPAALQGRSIEKLLLSFFLEGLSCSSDTTTTTSQSLQWRRNTKRIAILRCEAVEEELLKAASQWIGGDCGERFWVEDGEAELKEMERNGGWRCFDEEEEEVAADMEVGVLGWLLEELVLDLVSC